MKLLLCGTGKIGRDLLRHLGDEWEITLIDKSEAELSQAADISPEIQSFYAEDASSPIVQEKIGLNTFDYVIAMTNDDSVNRLVAEMAVEAGVPHVCALLTGIESISDLREMGVYVVQSTSLLSGNLFHYLQNPQMLVSPLGLGPASIVEIKAADHIRVVGKRADYLKRKHFRLVAIIRGEQIIFPRSRTIIRADDKLVILSEPGRFQTVCDLLECGSPHFPLAYGPGLLVAIGNTTQSMIPPVLNEGLHIAQNAQISNVTLLTTPDSPDFRDAITDWPQNVTIETRELDTEDSGNMVRDIREACSEGNFGLTVMPPVDESLFSFLKGSTYVALADDIVSPLLIARGTAPYKKILIPFNSTPRSELALEIGIDIARQFEATAVAIVVEQPDFITGEDEERTREDILKRIRELTQLRKATIETVVRQGNPVKEILAASQEYDLLILGCTNRSRGLLTPNIGERLARSAECSTLIVAL